MIKTIKSDFALLDVKTGRGWLYRYFSPRRKGYGIVGNHPKNNPIKIMIEAEIIDFWGNDDGISREFELKVLSVKVNQ